MSESHSVSIGSCTDRSPGVPLEIGTQRRGVGRGDLDEDQIRVVRGLAVARLVTQLIAAAASVSSSQFMRRLYR